MPQLFVAVQSSPFTVTQVHLFWGQWKGDEGVNNNAGLISKASEEIASEPHCRLTPFSREPP